MKNLEKFGVQELNQQEILEINGGSAFLIGIGIGLAVAGLFAGGVALGYAMR